jgi:ATP-binding cassette subfamily B protein
MQVKLDRINQVMRETLAGVRVIRAFVRTHHEEARFQESSVDLFNTSLKVNRLFAITIPVMTAILNLSAVAVMWFGAMRVDSGEMPIGNLTAFLQYLFQILFTVLMAVFMFIFVPRAAVSAGRIQEVLEAEPTVRDPKAPRPLPAGEGGGRVEFRDVEFRYPGAQDPVLRDVSFVAEPGETVAIVGSTGSGKSTLINLIPRFYDATSGSILVDGIDVRELDRQDLWRRLGVGSEGNGPGKGLRGSCGPARYRHPFPSTPSCVTQRIRNLRSRMPELGTSGSAGGPGPATAQVYPPTAP